MWDLPRPGLELVSPAWAGGFLTTAPRGKPCVLTFEKGFRSFLWAEAAPSYLPFSSFSPVPPDFTFYVSEE